MSAFRSMEPIASSLYELGSIFFFSALGVFRLCGLSRGLLDVGAMVKR